MTRFPARAPLARAAALTLLAAGALGAQTPTHAYSLNGTLADTFGGPSLVAIGSPAAALEGGASGYRFDPAGEGFSLTNALTNPGVYSVELRFLFDVTSGYRKVIDFQNLTQDQGFYNLSGTAVYFTETSGPPNAFTAGQFAHVVITRSATNVFSAYVDGTLDLSFTDASNKAVFAGNVINFLRDDMSQNSEHSSGFVDYVRIYDEALTAQQVLARFQAGDTNLSQVPEPATVALLAGGLLAVGGVAARRRRTA